MGMLMIFLFCIFIGVVFCIVAFHSDSSIALVPALIFIVVGVLGAFIATVELHDMDGRGIRDFNELTMERQIIESVLESTELNDSGIAGRIIDYNNEIISIKYKLSKWYYKEFFTDKVDWDSLELIEITP